MKLLLLGLLPVVVLCDAEVKWTGVRTVGPQKDCGLGGVNVRWEITIKDGKFTALSEGGTRWNLDISSLKADGSGRVEYDDARGRRGWVQFDAGQGPRRFHYNGGGRACVWQVNPR
jgi:hypothetical protein